MESAELLRAGQAGLEVADDRLAADEELVHQRLPGPDREPPGLDQPAYPGLGVSPDLEVVVDQRELAVQRKAQPLVSLEQLEQLVNDLDQRDAKALERPIPLPVPVGVRDEVNEGAARAGQLFTEPASRPCTK